MHLDSEHHTGVYQSEFYLQWALEDLDSFDNMELTYMHSVEPVMRIVEKGRGGGIKRLIARERFRKHQETSDYTIHADYEDFDDVDHGFDMLMADHQCWAIYFDGPGLEWVPEIEDCMDALEAILAREENTLVVLIDVHGGNTYVVRSPYIAEGRFHPDAGYYAFDEVVSFGEHPGHNTHEAYALTPEILEAAAEIQKTLEGYENEHAG